MPRITLDLNKEADRQKVKDNGASAPGWCRASPTKGWWRSSWILPRVWPIVTTPGGRFAKTSGRASQKASLSAGTASPWRSPQRSTASPWRFPGVFRDQRRQLRRDLDRRENRPRRRYHRRHQRATASRGNRKGRAWEQTCHRLPGGERSAGRTARRHLHALCDSGFRITELTFSSF